MSDFVWRNVVRGGASFSAALLVTTATQAAVNISTDPTQNMSCSGRVCTATAQKAYLNVNDVTSMLAGGDLKIVTGNGAQDIHVEAPFSWTSPSRLTLDAERSIEFKKPVTVAGPGALTLITNDGGRGGDYWFDTGANVTFWDLNSSLVISGLPYVLVSSISELANDVAHHAHRHYALANNYDASPDGPYAHAPIQTIFRGIFEGLGNTISDVAFDLPTGPIPAGFFAQVDTVATVRDLLLVGLDLICNPKHNDCGVTGGLAAYNYGTVNRTSVKGTIHAFTSCMGGLIGINAGTIARSSANVEIENAGTNGDFGCPLPQQQQYRTVGGLVAYNSGTIVQSSSNGYSAYNHHGSMTIGGLAGANTGTIGNSYATTNVQEGGTYYAEPFAGGLVGWNSNPDSGATVTHSYSTGEVSAGGDYYTCRGAFLGERADNSDVTGSYWDTDHNQGGLRAVGCGTETGITGLTDAQLRSGLPAGFDPAVWGQSPNINNGYPYLLANPPPSGNSAAKKLNQPIGGLR